MNVAIYSRVSTTDQNTCAQSHEMLAHATRKGWKVSEYTDTASGASTGRTGLQAMMTRIRKGGIHAVLVAKLDRLGRSLPHLIQIVAELDSLGVGLIVPSQGIDTSTNNPAGRLQLNVLAAVAEFEREIIRDRTRAGLAVARAKGKRLGRPPVTADLPEGWASMSVRELARAMGVSTGKAQAVRRAALAAGVA